MLNVDVFEGQWKQVRQAVRPHWQALTEADVKKH